MGLPYGPGFMMLFVTTQICPVLHFVAPRESIPFRSAAGFLRCCAATPTSSSPSRVISCANARRPYWFCLVEPGVVGNPPTKTKLDSRGYFATRSQIKVLSTTGGLSSSESIRNDIRLAPCNVYHRLVILPIALGLLWSS